MCAAAIHMGMSPLALEELPEEYLDTILHLIYVDEIITNKL